MGLLRERLAPGPAARLWATAVDAATVATRRCPGCDARMRTFTGEGHDAQVELDACLRCAMIWFDHAELERMGVRLIDHVAKERSDVAATPPASTPSAGRSVLSDAEATMTFLEILCMFFD